jgi:hypothetical protein
MASPQGKSRRLVVQRTPRGGKIRRAQECAREGNERERLARGKSPAYTSREAAQRAKSETGGKDR